jgi:hypothetical protein
MSSSTDWGRITLRNGLLGRWAAEKLGMTGAEADAYANALANDAFDPERNDVFSKIRKDFDAAEVPQSDEDIRGAMNDCMIRAGTLKPTKRGDSLAGAEVMLARNLIKP